MYQLQRAEEVMLVVPLKKYGIFKTNHLSPYCISYPATATSDTNEAHHDINPSSLVPEKLSLNSTAGLAVDQAKLECVGEIDEVVETNFENTQNKQSFTHSHETQILLRTSGYIDPDNTSEYIPACFNPVATLSQCTHDCRHYYNHNNDFGLEIPAGAIPEGETITIDIGVALHGPFQYPEGLRPVSPVFWVCVRDQKDYQFLKPVTVTIPHCLNLENHDDVESLDLTFLKGDHEMNPQQMYQFQQAEGDVLIEPLKKYGVIQATHFCSRCISCEDQTNLFEKTDFCLYSVIPQMISPDQPSIAYFFITFLLQTCLTTVKKQIKDFNIQGEKHTEKFQFSTEKTLEIILSQSPPEQWIVGIQGKKKILMSDVDFFISDKKKEKLEVEEREGMYPPRFHVVLSCSPSAKQCQTNIKFKGAIIEMEFVIPLTPALTTSPSSPSASIGGTQVPDMLVTRQAAPRTRNVSTSSSMDGFAVLASISSGHSSIHEQDGATPLSEQPTMPELLRLEIPQKVGSSYYTFGIFLLNDQTGSRVNSFKKECLGKPEDVTLMSLQEWLEGKGLPVTWSSLIQTLRDMKLTKLADHIQSTTSLH